MHHKESEFIGIFFKLSILIIHQIIFACKHRLGLLQKKKGSTNNLKKYRELTTDKILTDMTKGFTIKSEFFCYFHNKQKKKNTGQV
jgi:hypothetical protein